MSDKRSVYATKQDAVGGVVVSIGDCSALIEKDGRHFHLGVYALVSTDPSRVLYDLPGIYIEEVKEDEPSSGPMP